jgi:hypothetical protein
VYDTRRIIQDNGTTIRVLAYSMHAGVDDDDDKVAEIIREGRSDYAPSRKGEGQIGVLLVCTHYNTITTPSDTNMYFRGG